MGVYLVLYVYDTEKQSVNAHDAPLGLAFLFSSISYFNN